MRGRRDFLVLGFVFRSIAYRAQSRGRRSVDRICSPDRRKSILGGSERNFLFRTVRKTNIAPLLGRATYSPPRHRLPDQSYPRIATGMSQRIEGLLVRDPKGESGSRA